MSGAYVGLKTLAEMTSRNPAEAIDVRAVLRSTVNIKQRLLQKSKIEQP
jgi:hypothetical protein